MIQKRICPPAGNAFAALSLLFKDIKKKHTFIFFKYLALNSIQNTKGNLRYGILVSAFRQFTKSSWSIKQKHKYAPVCDEFKERSPRGQVRKHLYLLWKQAWIHKEVLYSSNSKAKQMRGNLVRVWGGHIDTVSEVWQCGQGKWGMAKEKSPNKRIGLQVPHRSGSILAVTYMLSIFMKAQWDRFHMWHIYS